MRQAVNRFNLCIYRRRHRQGFVGTPRVSSSVIARIIYLATDFAKEKPVTGINVILCAKCALDLRATFAFWCFDLCNGLAGG